MHYRRGTDGSEFTRFFALTIVGEPVGLVEHSASITANQKTHGILFFDFDPDNPWRLKTLHVQKGADFHDLVLQERPGYDRLTLVYECDAK